MMNWFRNHPSMMVGFYLLFMLTLSLFGFTENVILKLLVSVGFFIVCVIYLKIKGRSLAHLIWLYIGLFIAYIALLMKLDVLFYAAVISTLWCFLALKNKRLVKSEKVH